MFTILNNPNAQNNPAPFAQQARPDKVDIDILVAAQSGTGIPLVGGSLNGCAVTPHASGTSLNIDVSAGASLVGGQGAQVLAQPNLTIAPADASNPRRDLVSINVVGHAVVTTGVPGAVPDLPNVPAQSVAVAVVDVPARATAITATNIIDKRMAALARPSYLGLFNFANAGLGTVISFDLLDLAMGRAQPGTMLMMSFTVPELFYGGFGTIMAPFVGTVGGLLGAATGPSISNGTITFFATSTLVVVNAAGSSGMICALSASANLPSNSPQTTLDVALNTSWNVQSQVGTDLLQVGGSTGIITQNGGSYSAAATFYIGVSADYLP